jgi:ribosome-associated translation inhibitor RaiA
MLVQVRTDNHIPNSEDLTGRIRAEVEGSLAGRFHDRVRRVEVYLQDQNSHKKGVDKHCAIEAHIAGLAAVAVTDDASSVDEAVSGAVDKLLRTLERTLGRLDDRAGNVSMSGEPT